MLSDNKRLSFLIRKNSGRHKLNDYKQFFKGFNLKKLIYIDLEHSDRILDDSGRIFHSVVEEFEMIKNNSLQNSILIDEISKTVKGNDSCYIFTDIVDECGMFTCTTKSALQSCLGIAFLSYNNICFLTDCEYKFSFIIGYNGEDDRYYADKFEIQRKVVREIN